jgi:hypothetical protein
MAGRPTKLTQALVDKAAKYINEEVMLGGMYFGDLPSVAGLALYLDVARSSVYEWAEPLKEKPTTAAQKRNALLRRQFSDTLEKVLARQQYMLEGKSIKGEYNPTIAKMLLNVNHGMVEKTRTDITTNDQSLNPYGGLSEEELRALAQKRK